MQRELLLKDYIVRPAEVARTLLMTVEEWDGAPLATRASDEAEPLYTLRKNGGELVLTGPCGTFHLDPASVEAVAPDPLWESSAGICGHMEADHADTFDEFLSGRGWKGNEGSRAVMPWVEQRGFFLCHPEVLAWIAFPQVCPTPNDVRKSLIKMLRESRHE